MAQVAGKHDKKVQLPALVVCILPGSITTKPFDSLSSISLSPSLCLVSEGLQRFVLIHRLINYIYLQAFFRN